MARIFITGSADGLGKLSAKALIEMGHSVVLHARDAGRGKVAMRENPGAETVITGDLSNTDETKEIARQANALGTFDVVIHNAGVYTAPGTLIFRVNTLAPYILTCLMHQPKRLIYLTSGMHMQGHFQPDQFRDGGSRTTYADSKLHVVMLCMAVARRWPDVYANTVNPGWVPTKMGGSGAPDDLQQGYETQVWLATSDEEKAKVTGKYFFHKIERRHHPDADDIQLQEQLLRLCEEVTGVGFPRSDG